MAGSVRREGPSLILAATCAGILIAHHVASRSCRDALFLSHYPATELPKVMLAAAVFGLPLVLVLSRAVARIGPALLIPAFIALSGCLHAVEWVLLDRAPGLATTVLYLHATVATGIAVS